MGWLQHAFAIETEEAFAPTAEQQRLIDRFCQGAVRRRMVAPALLAMESFRPLHNIGAQAMVMLAPLVSLVVSSKEIEQLVQLLERPGCAEYVCRQLEETARAQPSSDPPA